MKWSPSTRSVVHAGESVGMTSASRFAEASAASIPFWPPFARSFASAVAVLGVAEQVGLGELEQLLPEPLQLRVGVRGVEGDRVGERVDRHAGARREVRVQVA